MASPCPVECFVSNSEPEFEGLEDLGREASAKFVKQASIASGPAHLSERVV